MGNALSLGSYTGVTNELCAAGLRVVDQLIKDPLALDLTAPELKEFSIFQTVNPDDIDAFMRLAMQDVRCKRAIGCLVGLAVADSVGSPFEFIAVDKSPDVHFNPKTLENIGPYNKFGLKPGQWTDDTSMGLCLADSLLACGAYDGLDIRVRFWNWWNRGYNNAFRLDDTRSDSVGLGGNISMSLLMMTQKTHITPRFEGLGEDAGNGSVMRLAPVPIFFHQDLELCIRVSAESSYTTHPGPSAADACAFLGFLIACAITRDVKCNVKRFLDGVVKEYLAKPEVEGQKDLVRLLQSSEPRGSKELCWNWRDPNGPFVLETIAARGKHYNGYPVLKDYFGSYSLDGLAIALHSVYHTRSYMAAITKCINCLGDADSTGAICGQIAGAFYGVDSVDMRLVEKLRRWDTGHIALRGALLYVLGAGISPEVQEQARKRSNQALRFDRTKIGDCPQLPRPPKEDKGPPTAPPKSKKAALLKFTGPMTASL